MKELAASLRMLIIDVVHNAQSGHLGMALGMADVITVLYRDFLHYIPEAPRYYNRDRLVFSAGHGSALLYSALYLTGYDWTINDLQQFRQFGSRAPGHPELDQSRGIETTTGPLGQGLGNAVGMAIEAKKLHNMNNLIDYKIYVVASDGDVMEGISHEAMSLAGHLKLNNLVILYDSNDVTIDGPLDLSCSDNCEMRFKSYNFNVRTINGHSETEIMEALNIVQHSDKPSIIICKTIIGKGIPMHEGSSFIHGKIPSSEIIYDIRTKNSWTPFKTPEVILNRWRQCYIRNLKKYNSIKKSVQNTIDLIKSEPILLHKDALKKVISDQTPKSTKDMFRNFLECIQHTNKILIGSADLKESNSIKLSWSTDMTAKNYSGNFINFGIREHAMAAIANGIGVNDLFKIFVSTFLVFSDYMRPSIRLSCLMKASVTYIFTHDSVLIGEDGPTHQPIEHTDSLRLIPGLTLYRPAVRREIITMIKEIITSNKTPTAVLLTRQTVAENGFIATAKEQDSNADVLIVTSGSEQKLAFEIKEIVEKKNIKVDIESRYKWPQKKNNETKNSPYKLIVSIEASTNRMLASEQERVNLRFCVRHYASSGSAESIRKFYGFDARRIAGKIMRKIKNISST